MQIKTGHKMPFYEKFLEKNKFTEEDRIYYIQIIMRAKVFNKIETIYTAVQLSDFYL